MSDPLIKSAVKWWFRLFTFSCVSVMLGVVVFIRTSIRVGLMTSTAYSYVAVLCVLALLGIVWVKSLISSAPEKIEGFLRRTRLYSD
jgi:hypothetical protein